MWTVGESLPVPECLRLGPSPDKGVPIQFYREFKYPKEYVRVYSDASDLLQPSHFLGIGAVKALTNGFDILTHCASVVSMERGRDSQYAKRLAVDEDIHDVDNKSM
jgi:hypothetical protein